MMTPLYYPIRLGKQPNRPITYILGFNYWTLGLSGWTSNNSFLYAAYTILNETIEGAQKPTDAATWWYC